MFAWVASKPAKCTVLGTELVRIVPNFQAPLAALSVILKMPTEAHQQAFDAVLARMAYHDPAALEAIAGVDGRFVFTLDSVTQDATGANGVVTFYFVPQTP